MDKFLAYLERIAPSVLSAILILVVGYIIARILLKVIRNLLKKSKIDKLAHSLILSILRIVVYALVVIIALTQMGVDMTSMIALLSVAGLAVSLAIQDSLSNLTGGIILLLSKPFAIGDFIDLGSVSGTVRKITILQTKLLTPDNKEIYIPNGVVSKGQIINFSSQDLRRLDLIFSISYHEDFEKAKSHIAAIVERHELAQKDPAPTIRVGELAASTVNIFCRVWVESSHYWDLNFDLIEQVKADFDASGIAFPFNQLQIHMDK